MIFPWPASVLISSQMTGKNHVEMFWKSACGLLVLQWDLICPLCRGAQDSGSSLKEIETSVHCETCKIDFTINFDRFVELTFRPNATVRRVEVGEYCIGSPQRTPHVVAQQ